MGYGVKCKKGHVRAGVGSEYGAPALVVADSGVQHPLRKTMQRQWGSDQNSGRPCKPKPTKLVEILL